VAGKQRPVGMHYDFEILGDNGAVVSGRVSGAVKPRKVLKLSLRRAPQGSLDALGTTRRELTWATGFPR
jgi:hypothetical protein